MTQLGVLNIDEVCVVAPGQITEIEARSAGFVDVKTLLSTLPKSPDPIYRIQVSFAGADPRISLRLDDDLSSDEMKAVFERLFKLDSRSKNGAWTREFLSLIEIHPNTRAADLAAKAGIEVLKFKLMVRKLKSLGLTESLDVGYRLSPRGEKILKGLLK